jgi:hypothetical protein
MIGVATKENGRARFRLVTGDELQAVKFLRQLRDMGAHDPEIIDLRTFAEINEALADTDEVEPEPS